MPSEVRTTGDVAILAVPEKRRSKRCAFTGRLSVWAGTRRYELQSIDASSSAVLAEAPAGLLRHPERLVGSLCMFPFEAAGYPIGPLRRRIRRFEIRRRGSGKDGVVLLFD
jgi:hypothetical protein